MTDKEVLLLLPAMKAISSYMATPTNYQNNLIERAKREGLLIAHGQFLVNWTDKGIDRFKSI